MLSRVVIVGRTNVGKSTLFNRIAGSKESIVFDYDGVTRDYIEHEISWNEKKFLLLDTGGVVIEKSRKRRNGDDAQLIEQEVQKQIKNLLKNASIVLFVCDAKVGAIQEDMLFARELHKMKKNVVLVANKSDNDHLALESNADFMKLGFKNIIHVSAIHGRGIVDLLDCVVNNIVIEKCEEQEKPNYNVSIVGKPNVGKSSLMNLLLKEQRSIVSSVAGTTREAISKSIFYCDNLIKLTDTAGARRKNRISGDLETLVVKSSLRSIRIADAVLLMIDASSGRLCDQEMKLLFYCFEQHKPVILLVNKYDLLKEDDYTRSRLEMSMEEYKFILKKIVPINISCLTKRNVEKVLNTVQSVLQRSNQYFDTDEIDEVVKKSLERMPMYHKRQKLKLFKIRYVKDAKVPTFVLHVNCPEWFGATQLGCIENILRYRYPLQSCPVVFNLRKI
jgi:GTPase